MDMAKAKAKYNIASQETSRLGETVRTYRKMRKITQEKLAELADVSVNTIYNLENGIGDAGFGTVSAVGRALQIPGDELMYGCTAQNENAFPAEFEQLDEEDRRFIRKSIKTAIKGCLSDMKYRLRA